MRIKVLEEKCILTRAHLTDAGWDLRSSKSYVIEPFETVKVKTGVCVEIPEGFSGDIRPRSSISSEGILVHYGTVDVGYTGEIQITVTNLNPEHDVVINQYDRIAQLVINRIDADSCLEIVEELGESDRGCKGFGSTGRS